MKITNIKNKYLHYIFIQNISSKFQLYIKSLLMLIKFFKYIYLERERERERERENSIIC